jgi:hypothetical protein
MRRLSLLMILAAGCTSGITPDTGLEAELRVSGATFIAGDLPAANGGPAVTEIDSNNNNIHPGEINKKLGGRLGVGGVVAAIQLDGDAGYWTIPATNFDSTAPTELDFSATLSFSSHTTAGMRPLHVVAVDGNGKFGAPSTIDLDVAASAVQMSVLDVRLTWAEETDEDLHVELPDHTVVWAGNINSYTPPPPPAQPDPAAPGGVLDLDSNQQCLIDGLREENVFWTMTSPPPSGTYEVRVDTFSLCGQPDAHWTVEVFQNGDFDHPVATAHGEATDADTKLPHDETSMHKAGVLALQFTL